MNLRLAIFFIVFASLVFPVGAKVAASRDCPSQIFIELCLVEPAGVRASPLIQIELPCTGDAILAYGSISSLLASSCLERRSAHDFPIKDHILDRIDRPPRSLAA